MIPTGSVFTRYTPSRGKFFSQAIKRIADPRTDPATVDRLALFLIRQANTPDEKATLIKTLKPLHGFFNRLYEYVKSHGQHVHCKSENYVFWLPALEIEAIISTLEAIAITASEKRSVLQARETTPSYFDEYLRELVSSLDENSNHHATVTNSNARNAWTLAKTPVQRLAVIIALTGGKIQRLHDFLKRFRHELTDDELSRVSFATATQDLSLEERVTTLWLVSRGELSRRIAFWSTFTLSLDDTLSILREFDDSLNDCETTQLAINLLSKANTSELKLKVIRSIRYGNYLLYQGFLEQNREILTPNDIQMLGVYLLREAFDPFQSGYAIQTLESLSYELELEAFLKYRHRLQEDGVSRLYLSLKNRASEEQQIELQRICYNL